MPTLLRRHFTPANVVLLASIVAGLSVPWHEGSSGSVSGWTFLGRALERGDSADSALFVLYLWGAFFWALCRVVVLQAWGAAFTVLGMLQASFFLLASYVFSGASGPLTTGTWVLFGGLVFHSAVRQRGWDGARQTGVAVHSRM